MSRTLSSAGVMLDFDALYERIWNLAADDRGDGTRLFHSIGQTSLTRLVAEMSASPVVGGRTEEPNNSLRSLVHRELIVGGWGRRTGERTFRLRRPPRAWDDYARLHDLMCAIPEGRWTTYGDLGRAAGIHPKGLGSHIKSKPCCPHAVRVLQAGGVPHRDSFRWSDPDDRGLDPNEVLASEGVRFVGGAADPQQHLGARELLDLIDQRDDSPEYEWPTLDWVASPPESGTERHLRDCESLGDGPRSIAEAPQLRDVPPCGLCLVRARASQHVQRGPSLNDGPSEPANEELRAGGTDIAQVVLVRREQRFLRRHLLAGRAIAACDICGRMLPTELLVAAHITPRASLDEAERLDFASAAMLACLFGCDAMFEAGYIGVNADGEVISLRRPPTPAVAGAVTAVEGLAAGRYTSHTAPRFAQHADLFAGLA